MEDCKEVATPIATNCLMDVDEVGQQLGVYLCPIATNYFDWFFALSNNN